jgi:hypothetical protein
MAAFQSSLEVCLVLCYIVGDISHRI